MVQVCWSVVLRLMGRRLDFRCWSRFDALRTCHQASPQWLGSCREYTLTQATRTSTCMKRHIEIPSSCIRCRGHQASVIVSAHSIITLVSSQYATIKRSSRANSRSMGISPTTQCIRAVFQPKTSVSMPVSPLHKSRLPLNAVPHPTPLTTTRLLPSQRMHTLTSTTPTPQPQPPPPAKTKPPYSPSSSSTSSSLAPSSPPPPQTASSSQKPA